MAPAHSERSLFRFDEGFRDSRGGVIAGVDEAGRGPLAGPVVAAAVILKKRIQLPGLNDSKQIPPRRREALFSQILSRAAVGVGIVSEIVIDQINILQATRRAMREALLALSPTPTLILIDGPIQLDVPVPQVKVIAGDARSASIAAASIVAKVFRDRVMQEWDRLYPGYGFARHKGYPTEEHLQVLRQRGPIGIHRKSFHPVSQLVRESSVG